MQGTTGSCFTNAPSRYDTESTYAVAAVGMAHYTNLKSLFGLARDGTGYP